LGTFTLRGQDTPFVLGPLTTAFEVANEAGSCVLILEEINALTPQMQKVLNPLTDWRAAIEVPEAKTVFRLKTGAKLWVVGTMNFSVYGGTYALNEDLKSRFRMIPIDYPKKSEEKEVLLEILRQRGLTTEPAVLNKLLTLAHESRQGSVDYAFSTRDLVQILEDVQLVGLNKALWIASGKFEGSDRTMLTKRIESVFGIAPAILGT
jgi:MoxR-like ATPase